MDELNAEKLSLLDGEFDDPNRIFHWAYHGGGPGIEGSKNAPDGACKNYTQEYWTDIRRNTYANIAQIDDYVGRLINAAESKFGDDLMIIFTSDHGDVLGNHNLWGKNTCAYEDVLSVPLMVRYPGDQNPRRDSTRVMSTNICPTILKAAGIEENECDGVDYLDDVSRGGSRYTFAEGERFVTVSDGRHKYVQVEKGGKQFYELFDLTKDPEEFYNVIDDPEYQVELANMRREVTNHFIHTLLP